jgi:hypothetical protein
MAVNTRAVVGVFHNQEKADAAVADLYDSGFTYDQIGVVARTDAGTGDWSDPTTRPTAADATMDDDTGAEEGAVAGAAVGAGVGGLWALGIAAGALPAIGPVVAGGILASLLASAALGAAAGGLVGALIGLGIPEEEAQYYEEEFRSGRILVTVRANGREEEAREILLSHGAVGVDGRVMTPTA